MIIERERKAEVAIIRYPVPVCDSCKRCRHCCRCHPFTMVLECPCMPAERSDEQGNSGGEDI